MRLLAREYSVELRVGGAARLGVQRGPAGFERRELPLRLLVEPDRARGEHGLADLQTGVGARFELPSVHRRSSIRAICGCPRRGSHV